MELFTFMKWPLVACLILPWLLVYLGLHVVQRQIIFVDLALAQVAALGTCLAIIVGHDVHSWQSYAWSAAFTVVGAIVFTLTRTRDPRVPHEALIGIIYVVAAAAGILVLSGSAGGKEELQRSLIGELLVVSPAEIWQTFALYALVGGAHYVWRDKFMAVSLAHGAPLPKGISVRWWDFVFYVLFGFVVTSFVHIGGVLLTFSFLIVPAVSATYLADSFRARVIVGWILATIASLGSLYATTKVDWPIGATMVCALGLSLVMALVVARFRPRPTGMASHPPPPQNAA